MLCLEHTRALALVQKALRDRARLVRRHAPRHRRGNVLCAEDAVVVLVQLPKRVARDTSPLLWVVILQRLPVELRCSKRSAADAAGAANIQLFEQARHLRRFQFEAHGLEPVCQVGDADALVLQADRRIERLQQRRRRVAHAAAACRAVAIHAAWAAAGRRHRQQVLHDALQHGPLQHAALAKPLDALHHGALQLAALGTVAHVALEPRVAQRLLGSRPL
mmetsp:Transcript_31861/g.95123  ORF Transcript_31861/g.95123 Transcript_31861/m.95123 type:complete len:220 (-) Transcript_31861:1421-2080(-)